MHSHLSMNGNVNRYRHDLREKEEKRNQQRRKHLLHIISDYLNSQGYTKSSATLTAEAQLSANVQVCDNIDLEIILKDYEEYYYVKFNKYPVLCKKGGTVDSANATPQSHAEIKQTENKINNKSEPQKKKDKEDVNDLCLAITMKPIFNGRTSNFKSTEPAPLPTISQTIEDLYGANSEMRKIAEMISKEIIMKDFNVKWDDVKGLSQCKTAIYEAIVYPIKYPQCFQGRFSPWRGILLYGPPGTGKTMLAKATATECNCTFINVSASSLVSKWRGDSEKYVRALFDLAYERAPTVIFIDEIDWIATVPEESSLSEPARRLRAEILANLDGLLSNEFANVLLLAATNTPWNLDAALLRRLEKHIYVPLPDTDSRVQILRTYVSESDKDMKLASISNDLDGYSCSDIKRVCKQAWIYQMTPVMKLMETGTECPVTPTNKILSLQHITAAREVIKPTVNSKLNELYTTWKKKYF